MRKKQILTSLGVMVIVIAVIVSYKIGVNHGLDLGTQSNEVVNDSVNRIMQVDESEGSVYLWLKLPFAKFRQKVTSCCQKRLSLPQNISHSSRINFSYFDYQKVYNPSIRFMYRGLKLCEINYFIQQLSAVMEQSLSHWLYFLLKGGLEL